jgi:hypothetical protein
VKENDKQNWIARMCGFRNAAELESSVDGEGLSVELRAAIEQQEQKARELFALYQECRLAAWDEGFLVETFHPQQDHSTDAWLQERGLDVARGQIRTMRSTHLGDRVFRLHFDSTYYPLLDEEAKRVGASRREILRRLRR